MTSDRVTAAFSAVQEYPEAAELSRTEAVAEDADLNSAHFGVADPAAVLRELSDQFRLAPTGQASSAAVVNAFVVLDVLREDSLSLVNHYAALLNAPEAAKAEHYRDQHALHAAEVTALVQAERLVEELAGELGIHLPADRGTQQTLG